MALSAGWRSWGSISVFHSRHCNVYSLSWPVFFMVSPQNAKTEPPSFRPKEGNWTKVLDSRPMNYCKRASIPGTVSCFKCKINEVADALSLPDNQLLQRSQGWVVAIGNGISPESESWQSNKKKSDVHGQKENPEGWQRNKQFSSILVWNVALFI